LKNLEIKLKGGLGNQLFQCFAGLHLANHFGRNLKLDLTWYRYIRGNSQEISKRDFELGSYSFSQKIEKTFSQVPAFRERLDQLLRRSPKPIGAFFGYANEMSTNCQVSKKDIRSEGYWLRQEYLPSIETLRRLLIEEMQDKSDNYFRISREMYLSNPTVIHVRLGDYRKFPEVFGVCNVGYYANAIKLLQADGILDENIWLFSDEPWLANQMIDRYVKVSRVISLSEIQRPAELLALMSQARALIASNSTLSWWAGYLNANSTATVIFPKFYLVNQSTLESGLYVNSWNYL